MLPIAAIGPTEIWIIVGVIILLFGVKKLPELGRTLGKGISELKAAMRGVKDTLDEAGSDVTEEIKEAKSGLEESIYKSIETNLDEKEGVNKEAEEKGDPQAGKDISKTAGEEDKGKKETDKDG